MTTDEALRVLDELIAEIDLSLRMPGHHKHENARLMQRRANLSGVREIVEDKGNDICKCGDRRHEHDDAGCRVCRQSEHMQVFPVCRGFRLEQSELSYPGRPNRVVLRSTLTGLTEELQGLRRLLVDCDSELSAIAHGRGFNKQELIDLSMQCRKAYEGPK